MVNVFFPEILNIMVKTKNSQKRFKKYKKNLKIKMMKLL